MNYHQQFAVCCLLCVCYDNVTVMEKVSMLSAGQVTFVSPRYYATGEGVCIASHIKVREPRRFTDDSLGP